MNSAGSALSLKRWWRSAGFAWAGIAHSYRTQPNFRIETWAAALALALTVWLRAPLAPIALACALVLALELVNTAVEAMVDLVSPEHHPLAKVAKETLSRTTSSQLLILTQMALSPVRKFGRWGWMARRNATSESFGGRLWGKPIPCSSFSVHATHLQCNSGHQKHFRGCR